MPASTAPSSRAFDHLALMYAGVEGFVAGTVPFLRDGVAAGEPMLVVVAAAKLAALRAALGRDADRVHFADMAEVGHNPARIIPAWRAFLDANGGGTRRVRGIGEPVYAERTAAELVECQLHESLLNVAFEGSGSWSLLCPYDTEALPAAVIAEAERSHPVVMVGGERRLSRTYRQPDEIAPFDRPLPAAVGAVTDVPFASGRDLAAVRSVVGDFAAGAGLPPSVAAELVLAVHEVVTNSVRHGGGQGMLRLWIDGAEVVCEVRDAGRIGDPLVGRARPGPEAIRGRGMWMANQLCDLVQIRSQADGAVVRLRKARPPR